MRLWTVHPKYLDSRGLCGLWRESLLAQAVLSGRTAGYRNHPQLERFRLHNEPQRALSTYLLAVHAESQARGYRFDHTKIGDPGARERMPETDGQLLWEWGHLMAKLRVRAPDAYGSYAGVRMPEPHPMFDIVAGPLREWERAAQV